MAVVRVARAIVRFAREYRAGIVGALLAPTMPARYSSISALVEMVLSCRHGHGFDKGLLWCCVSTLFARPRQTARVYGAK